MPDLDEDKKRIIKEALKEWMDERYAEFGRWAFVSIMAFIFAGLVYFALIASGWHR